MYGQILTMNMIAKYALILTLANQSSKHVAKLYHDDVIK